MQRNLRQTHVLPVSSLWRPSIRWAMVSPHSIRGTAVDTLVRSGCLAMALEYHPSNRRAIVQQTVEWSCDESIPAQPGVHTNRMESATTVLAWILVVFPIATATPLPCQPITEHPSWPTYVLNTHTHHKCMDAGAEQQSSDCSA